MEAADTELGVVKAEIVLFGGANSWNDLSGLNTTLRLDITNETKQWELDDEMPYGRVAADAVTQPNGKILIFNGHRYGSYSGGIGRNVIIVFFHHNSKFLIPLNRDV